MKAKELLEGVGFKAEHESDEVLQFSGVGFVDILFARRPISQEILKNSNEGGPEGIKFVTKEALIGLKIQAYKNNSKREFQDKADIQFLIESDGELDWAQVKEYADLFGEWEVIDEIKNKCKSWFLFWVSKAVLLDLWGIKAKKR